MSPRQDLLSSRRHARRPSGVANSLVLAMLRSPLRRLLGGDAPDKQWWRNFTAPGPIEVRRGGRTRAGTARIVPPDNPAYASAWQLYTKRHHIARQPTDRLLLIENT